MKHKCHLCNKSKPREDMIYLGQGLYRCLCHRQKMILKPVVEDTDVAAWWCDSDKYRYLIGG